MPESFRCKECGRPLLHDGYCGKCQTKQSEKIRKRDIKEHKESLPKGIRSMEKS
jgi:uncharacterized Zn finger protein (UPF0148 family)